MSMQLEAWHVRSSSDSPGDVLSGQKNGDDISPFTPPKQEETGDPPDGGLKAWLVLLAAFLLNFVDLGFTYGFGVYQEEYTLREFPTVSTTLIDLIGSSCVAVTLFLGAFIGLPCQRYGFRAVASVGAAVFFIGAFSAGFCDSVPTLVVTQGITLGAGAGMMFVPGAAIPAQWFKRRLALAIGIAAAGAGVGGAFWSLIGRVLIANIGRKWALRASSFINLFLCVIAIALLEERKPHSTTRRTEPIVDLSMFKKPLFVVLYAASAISVFGYLVPFFYVPTFATTVTLVSPFKASLLVSMMNLASALGRIVLGAVADTRVGKMNTVIGGMFLAGACQWLLWNLANYTSSFALSFVFSMTYGLFGGGYIGIFPVVLAEVFDHSRLAPITGLFFTSELLGQTTGGPIAGAILQHANGIYYPMIIYSGLSLILGSGLGLLAGFMALRAHRADIEELVTDAEDKP